MEQCNMEYLMWLNFIVAGLIALFGLRAGYCHYCECCSKHNSD